MRDMWSLGWAGHRWGQYLVPGCPAAVLAHLKSVQGSPRDAARLGEPRSLIRWCESWLNIRLRDLRWSCHPHQMRSSPAAGLGLPSQAGPPWQHALSLPHQTRASFSPPLGCVFPIKQRSPGIELGPSHQIWVSLSWGRASAPQSKRQSALNSFSVAEILLRQFQLSLCLPPQHVCGEAFSSLPAALRRSSQPKEEMRGVRGGMGGVGPGAGAEGRCGRTRSPSTL